MKGPHGAKSEVRVRMTLESLLKKRKRVFCDRLFDRATLQDDAGPPRMPGTLTKLKLSQVEIAECSEIVVSFGPILGLRLLGSEAVDAPGVFVQNVLSADITIVPVECVEGTVRSELHTEADPLGVVGMSKIASMTGDESGTFWSENIGEDGVFMKVAHEEIAVVFFRKGIRQIDPGSPVSRPVRMVNNRANVLINIGVEVATSLSMVDATWDNVKHVRNDAGGDEEITFGVIVDSPRIAKSVSDHLKTIFGRMISPDSAIDVDWFSFELDLLRERIPVFEKLAFAFWFSNA